MLHPDKRLVERTQDFAMVDMAAVKVGMVVDRELAVVPIDKEVAVPYLHKNHRRFAVVIAAGTAPHTVHHYMDLVDSPEDMDFAHS